MQRGMTNMLNAHARHNAAWEHKRKLTRPELMKFNLMARILGRMPNGVSKRISLALAELYG